MSEPYDSEDGKDAWKQYRRLIESIDPAVQSMLHTFGSEQYQYGYAAGLDAAREAVAAVQRWHEYSWGMDDDESGEYLRRDDVLAAIDALRTGQEAGDLPGNEQPVTGLADHPSSDGSARTT